MIARLAFFGVAAGVLAAAGAIVAPAFGATEHATIVVRSAPVMKMVGGFTPASADPRLAAVFARGGLDASDFRFTPAETSRDGRAVTVAVRARANRTLDTTRAVAIATPAAGIAPIAYNLGVAVGWKRFAVASDVSHIDLGALPGGRDAADVSLSYSGHKFGARLKAATDRPLANAAQLTESMPTYSVDMGGSYALTHNLDVTAGVRYRSDRERLARADDTRRESQAVYVGTAFRF